MPISIVTNPAKVVEVVSSTGLQVISEEVIAAVEVVTTGPQGPQGPAGGYEHTQSSPASVWTVPHNLGRYPNVAVYVGAVLVITEVVNVSVNVSQILLATASTGKAVFS